MLGSFPFSLLIATVLGFLTGLGIGGGSLLIIWLTMVLDYPQQEARTMNLLFFLPAAIVSLYLKRRHTPTDWRSLLPGILSGAAMAAVFSWISAGWNTEIMKKTFGVLLLITAVRELLYKPKKDRAD